MISNEKKLKRKLVSDRISAAVVDVFFGFFAYFFVVSILARTGFFDGVRSIPAQVFFGVLFLVAVMAAMQAIAEIVFGRTPGKMVVGLRSVYQDIPRRRLFGDNRIMKISIRNISKYGLAGRSFMALRKSARASAGTDIPPMSAHDVYFGFVVDHRPLEE